MAAMSDVATVAKALFGDLVDPDALVAKMDPGPSDVHSYGESNRAVLIPRKTGRRREVSERVRFAAGRNSERVRFGKDNQFGRHIMEGVGIGATGVGAVLGARELNESLPKAAGLWRAKQGWMVPAKTGAKLAKIPRPGPAARVAGVTGMLAGDAIATNEQVRNARKPASVGKALPGVGDLVSGILRNSRKMNEAYVPKHAEGQYVGRHVMPKGPRHAAPKGTKPTPAPAAPAPAAPKPGDKGMAAGQKVRADVNNFARTGTGKVVLGAAGAGLVGHMVARRSQPSPAPYDPYVGKAAADDITLTGTFSKFDDERRLAFGWANVSKVNGLPVVDRQGDYCSIEDIEDAAYAYVEHSRVGGHMHRRVGGKAAGTLDAPYQAGTMIESMVFDDDKCEALGLPDDFPRGWWFGMRVSDDEVWGKAKRGELTGFSIHGKGIRKSVDYDEIMSR